LHPHSWIRLATSRIFGIYLSTLQIQSFADPNYLSTTLFSTQSEIFRLSKILCEQLNSIYLNDVLGEQIVKNLLFIALAMANIPDFLSSVDEGELVIPSEQQETEEKEHPELKELKEQNKKTPKNRGVNWIFHRLSYMARRDGSKRRECIFRWFAAMMSKMEPQDGALYLLHALNPLYRVAEMSDYYKDSDAVTLKSFANEVIEIIQNKVGAALFVPVYDHVRKQVLGIRQQRKNKRKVEAISNPERFALKKVAKNLKKRDRRKQHIDDLRVLESRTESTKMQTKAREIVGDGVQNTKKSRKKQPKVA